MTLEISAPNIAKELLIQTWKYCAFVISDRPLSKMDSCVTETSALPYHHFSLRYLPFCVSLTAGAFCRPALVCLHRAALLFLCLLCVLSFTLCPTQATPACLDSQQRELCQLSLCLPPPAIQFALAPYSGAAQPLLIALSWLSSLAAILSCAPFVILALGPSRGRPTNLADYFLFLNNCPLSKILWLSNHFHWGAKQLLMQGAPSGKVSSIKQWTT